MSQLRVVTTESPSSAANFAPGTDGAVSGSDAEFELDFVNGLPGFPHLRRFAIAPLPDGLEPFSRMHSLEQPGLEFIVFPPGTIFPDYVVEINEEATERLGLGAEDAVVLAIVTLTDGGAPPTANLLGPLVINRANHTALQVVQHGTGYDVAVPLVVPSAEPA